MSFLGSRLPRVLMLRHSGFDQLPLAFAQAIPSLQEADLLIVMGTSLTVHPFASLANRVPPDCPRVLINLDRVGDFGSQIDDVVLLGECDRIAKQLCVELGWEKELMDEWEATEGSVEQHDADDVVDQIVGEEHDAEDNLTGPSQKVEDIVDQLAGVLAKSIDLIADEKEKEKQVPPNLVADGEEDEEEEEEAVNGAPAAGALLPETLLAHIAHYFRCPQERERRRRKRRSLRRRR